MFNIEKRFLFPPRGCRQVHCKTSCIAQTTTCSTLSWANITFVPRTVSAGDSILGQLSGVFQTLPLLCESSDKSRADSGSLPLSVLRHLNTPCSVPGKKKEPLLNVNHCESPVTAISI